MYDMVGFNIKGLYTTVLIKGCYSAPISLTLFPNNVSYTHTQLPLTKNTLLPLLSNLGLNEALLYYNTNHGKISNLYFYLILLSRSFHSVYQGIGIQAANFFLLSPLL